jgi:hypothetical protein
MEAFDTDDMYRFWHLLNTLRFGPTAMQGGQIRDSFLTYQEELLGNKN